MFDERVTGLHKRSRHSYKSVNMCEGGNRMRWYTSSLRAILAGIYVAMGCVSFVCAENQILGSFLFSVGLFAIAVFNLPLFTGRVYRVVIAPSERTFVVFFELVVTWFANYFGVYLVTTFLRVVRHSDAMIDTCARIANHRLHDGPVGLFILGLGCNLILYLAFRAYRERQDLVGAITMLLLAWLSVVCKLEHSLADGFFLIMMRTTLAERVKVLLPVALGNGVGAIVPALLIGRPQKRSDNIVG